MTKIHKVLEGLELPKKYGHIAVAVMRGFHHSTAIPWNGSSWSGPFRLYEKPETLYRDLLRLSRLDLIVWKVCVFQVHPEGTKTVKRINLDCMSDGQEVLFVSADGTQFLDTAYRWTNDINLAMTRPLREAAGVCERVRARANVFIAPCETEYDIQYKLLT